MRLVSQIIKTNRFFNPQLLSVMGMLLVLGFYFGVKTFAATDTKPPDQPQNVRGTAVDDTTIRVTWDAVSNSDLKHYVVSRDGNPVATVGASSTPGYNDSGVPVHSTHTYYINAVDLAGNLSAESTIITAVSLTDTTLPTTPLPLTGTYDKATGQVKLSWQPSGDKNGLLGYMILRNIQQIPDNNLNKVTTTGTTYTDTTPQANASIKYTVEAIDAYSNHSDKSNILVMTTDTKSPNAPSNLHTNSTSSNSVSMAWDAVADNDGFGIKSYRIYQNGTKLTDQSAGIGSTYYAGGLASSTSYTFAVSAVDPSGNESAKSSSITATTQAGNGSDGLAPSVPTNLKATRSGDAVNLTWNASTDNVGVASYTITRNNSILATIPSTDTGNSYTDSTESTNADVSYTIAATDAAGNKSVDSGVIKTFIDTMAPTAPSSLSAVANVSATSCNTGTTVCSVQLRWVNSTDNQAVSNYIIYRNGTNIGTSASNAYMDSQAPLGVTVKYKVVAKDAAGNKSSDSNIASAVTTDTSYPVASIASPRDGAFVTGVSAVLTGSQDNVGVTKSELYLDGTLLTTLTSPSSAYNWDSSTVGNGVHTITVRSYDLAGNATQASIAVTTSNHETSPPTAPSSLNVTQTTARGLTLTWSASTDNVGVKGYYVMRNGVMVNIASTSSYSDEGLSPSTTYSYYVYAFDAAGNISSQSPAISATTTVLPNGDTVAPNTPTDLVATKATAEQVNLSWNSSADNVGVSSYQVYRCSGTCTDPNTGFSFIKNTTATSYGDASLTPSTTYSYYIKAADYNQNQSLASNIISTTTPAQIAGTGNITGTVKDVKTLVPLTSAVITLNIGGKNHYYTMSATGFYAIKSLASGQTYGLNASANNYSNTFRSVTVTASNTTYFANLALTHQ